MLGERRPAVINAEVRPSDVAANANHSLPIGVNLAKETAQRLLDAACHVAISGASHQRVDPAIGPLQIASQQLHAHETGCARQQDPVLRTTTGVRCRAALLTGGPHRAPAVVRRWEDHPQLSFLNRPRMFALNSCAGRSRSRRHDCAGPSVRTALGVYFPGRRRTNIGALDVSRIDLAKAVEAQAYHAA